MVNAEVTKSGSESSLSVIRKFSRRVQGTGLVKNVRDRRYYERPKSKTVQKKQALKRIARWEKRHELIKEGKMAEAPARRGRSYRPEAQTQAQVAANAQQSAPSTGRSSGLGESTPIAR